MRSDAIILFVAAALGAVFLATGQVTANGQYIVFLALFVCALVLIGIKHALTSMRRPLVAFAWCMFGGILGGGLSWFLANAFVNAHPIHSHGEDYGAMAAGILYVGILILSPIAGFLVGFPMTLAIYAVIQSMGPKPTPSEKHSGLA
jgi:hypothetical protein